MEFVIKEIDNDGAEIEDVKSFLYNQIKKEYGIGPDMRFHYDIEGIEEYYIAIGANPTRLNVNAGRTSLDTHSINVASVLLTPIGTPNPIGNHPK